MSTHNYLDKTGLGQVWDKIKALITQSNWEEDTSSDSAYILNKPSIKSGDGENSVLVGQIEQNSTSEIYTLYLTGAANATTFTYTTDATLPSDSAVTLTKWVLRYDNGNVKNFRNVVSIDQTNNLITLESKLSSTATLTNAEVLLYYNYKIAFGKNSYAEGANTFAADNMTHAEGNTTKALGLGSHTEGIYTIATGGYSHSEGSYSKASGGFSHAEGQYTIAASSYQHVQGKCNIEDSNNVYAHIVGNGSSKNARSNAHTLDWNGNGWYAGKLTVGTAPTNNMDVATKQYVDDNIPTVPTKVSDLTNDSGFITSYTETDPIFVASPAYGITSTDISNWNGKANSSDVLTKTNATSYTPTANYHPATKKYVDDATSGITSNLSGLTDTTISSPANGQVLMYNSTTSKWENSSISREVMNITITSTGSGNNITYSADKTYSEISTHINNGGVPIAFYQGNCYHLEYFDSYEEEMCFSYITNNGLVIYTQNFYIFSNTVKYSESRTQRLDVSLGISGNVIQLKNGDNTVMSSITLPVYNGGVSS